MKGGSVEILVQILGGSVEILVQILVQGCTVLGKQVTRANLFSQYSTALYQYLLKPVQICEFVGITDSLSLIIGTLDHQHYMCTCTHLYYNKLAGEIFT